MLKIFIVFISLFLLHFTVSGEVRQSNRISITEKNSTDYKIKKTFKQQSVLSSGKWYKISTTKQGIHKISYSRLKELGITNPSNLAVYGNGGGELPKSNSADYPDDLSLIPVIHQKDKNGNDCVYFYSPGNVHWKYNEANSLFTHDLNSFTDTTYFFITSDIEKSPVPSINNITTNTPEKYFTEYDDLKYLEEETQNMIFSGRTWYGEKINSMSKRIFSFDFPKAISGTTSSASLSFIGRSFDKSKLLIEINDTPLDTAIFYPVYRDEETHFAREYKNSLSFKTKDVIRVEVFFDTNNQWGEAWLDYISLNVRCKLVFDSEQLTFRNKDALYLSSAGYSIATQNKNMLIWDITNPLHPEHVNTFDTGTGIVNFFSTGNEIRSFVAFDPLSESFPDETKIKSIAVENQNIHSLPSHDMVIVTHPDFLIPSEELAQYHRDNDNMKVLVVTINQVFNEFSSGSNDLTAIRNMMRMFYSKSADSQNPLKYLLLMGDGSYDNRKFDINKSNFIPTYQSVNSLNPVETLTSDDYFGFLDDDEYELEGNMDIGVGRIPCKTKEEAQSTINKIFDYSSSKSLGDWRNVVCFIADDEESNFTSYSEDLINLISENYPGFYADKIYFDSYKQVSTSGGNRYPEVTEAINKRVEDGALILNYIGHGNPNSLAHENVLGINDIKSWNNNVFLPIFVTATCQFGRFDQDEVSAGEQILLNPSGGGIGLFTTTRVVYA
ncbi:MAG: type IX secretion system sortase PorU, partial [Prolixibacteraceae bacterium]|nr:type IX secretion system sortase PorU [Prolixibacteraceae bacterium]